MQVVPQTVKPELHTKPQAVPSQVAVAFMGGEHAVHDVVPQLLGLMLLTHTLPHR